MVDQADLSPGDFVLFVCSSPDCNQQVWRVCLDGDQGNWTRPTNCFMHGLDRVQMLPTDSRPHDWNER